jgi:hypothetical protein
MEIASVRELAKDLDKGSEQLKRALVTIERLRTGLHWRGTDAHEFDSAWRTRSRPAIQSTATALSHTADDLRKQADEQERTSAGTGSGSGGGSPGPFGWLQDGANWVGDKIEDGVAWTSDKIEDVVGGAGQVVDRVGDSLGAFGTGLGRMGEATQGFLGNTVSEVLQGKPPQVSEVLAYGALMYGLNSGAMANLLSGKDQRFFANGQPVVGEAQLVTGQTVGGEKRAVEVPTNFTSLMQNTMNTYDTGDADSTDGVRVTAVRNPGEPTRYIVSIPGTEAPLWPPSEGGWSGQANGRDWPANLWSIATGTSGFTAGASDAIAKAIAADQAAHGESGGGTPQILLTGHSQGGIIAANLASDPAFASQYDIRGIVTAGSPVDCAEVPGNVPVLSMQNGSAIDGKGGLGDPVPQLDLGGINIFGLPENNPNITSVNLGEVSSAPFDNHYQSAYMDQIRNELGQAGNPIASYEQQTNLGDFYSTDGNQTETYEVKVQVTFS